MGMLAWVIMGLALWHYTIFLPDRFWGGIVGAFVASIIGAIVGGLLLYAIAHGVFVIPGRHGHNATHLVTVLYAVPGALLGIAAVYMVGAMRESGPRGRAAGSLP